MGIGRPGTYGQQWLLTAARSSRLHLAPTDENHFKPKRTVRESVRVAKYYLSPICDDSLTLRLEANDHETVGAGRRQGHEPGGQKLPVANFLLNISWNSQLLFAASIHMCDPPIAHVPGAEFPALAP